MEHAHSTAATSGRPPAITMSGADYRTADRTLLEDVGEHIGGARKDLSRLKRLTLADLSTLNPTEAWQLVDKEHVWPQPAYDELSRNGVDPVRLLTIKMFRDRMPPRPDRDNDVSRAAFVAALSALAALADAFLRDGNTTPFGYDRILKLSPEAFLDSLLADHDAATRQRALEQFRRPYWRAAQLFSDHNQSVVRYRAKTHSWAPRARARATPAPAGDTTTPPKPRIHSRPHLDRLQRIGPEHAAGAQVNPQVLVNVFGMRAVEYGNWVANDERHQATALAIDALHDLADVLNVPPAWISLGGRLAMAIGARGHGGHAVAHYEPARQVYNLSKIRGAGSMAHEWAHAGDNLLAGRLDTASAGQPLYLSELAVLKNPPAKPPLLEVTRAVMAAIRSRALTPAEETARITRMLADSIRYVDTHRATMTNDGLAAAADRQAEYRALLARITTDPAWRPARVGSDYLAAATKLGEYWLRPRELFARAFECWVSDRLAAAGRRSDYLVHSVDEATTLADPWRRYPVGAERAAINTALDDWMAAARALTFPS